MSDPIACPICGTVHEPTELLGVYCSGYCAERDGFRKCGSCWTYQPEESFQPPRRVHGGIRALVEGLLELPPPPCVCEECAETCVTCGVRQPDVDYLDKEGRCRACAPECVTLPLPEIDLPSLDAYERQLRAGLDAYEGRSL